MNPHRSLMLIGATTSLCTIIYCMSLVKRSWRWPLDIDTAESWKPAHHIWGSMYMHARWPELQAPEHWPGATSDNGHSASVDMQAIGQTKLEAFRTK
jgi:hypothetical protein